MLRCTIDIGGLGPAYVNRFSHYSFTDRIAQREVPSRADAQRSRVRRDCRALHGSFFLLALAVPGIAERLLGYGVGDGDDPSI